MSDTNGINSSSRSDSFGPDHSLSDESTGSSFSSLYSQLTKSIGSFSSESSKSLDNNRVKPQESSPHKGGLIRLLKKIKRFFSPGHSSKVHVYEPELKRSESSSYDSHLASPTFKSSKKSKPLKGKKKKKSKKVSKHITKPQLNMVERLKNLLSQTFPSFFYASKVTPFVKKFIALQKELKAQKPKETENRGLQSWNSCAKSELNQLFVEIDPKPNSGSLKSLERFIERSREIYQEDDLQELLKHLQTKVNERKSFRRGSIQQQASTKNYKRGEKGKKVQKY